MYLTTSNICKYGILLFTEYGTTSFNNDVTELELEDTFPTEPQGIVLIPILETMYICKELNLYYFYRYY